MEIDDVIKCLEEIKKQGTWEYGEIDNIYIQIKSEKAQQFVDVMRWNSNLNKTGGNNGERI